jgi:hypothetical protein
MCLICCSVYIFLNTTIYSYYWYTTICYNIPFISHTHLVPGRNPLCFQNSPNSSGNGTIAQQVSRDLTCARKTFPIPLHHRHQPVLLTPGRMGPWSQLLTPNPDSANRITQHEPEFVGPGDSFPLLNYPVLVITCFFLFLVNRSGTQCGRLL